MNWKRKALDFLKHKRVQGAILALIGIYLTFIPDGKTAGIICLTTGLGWLGYGAYDAEQRNRNSNSHDGGSK